MNFIAGAAMLFLGVEDTFWFLVAVTEKYFDKSYFDHALTGAQADQVGTRHSSDMILGLFTVTLNISSFPAREVQKIINKSSLH